MSNNGKGTPIITFRVGSGKLAEALTARDYKHESHRSEIAKRDLTRYYALLERSLATVQLTEAEANALCDANNMSGFEEALPASMLWANVLDTPGLETKWGIETDLLVSKVRSLSPLQSTAVMDAIERFWVHSEDSTVQSVGLAK